MSSPDAGQSNHDAGHLLDAGQPDAGFSLPPETIVPGLSGLRWELPCITYSSESPEIVCTSDASSSQRATVLGTPGRIYEITVRIRGVVETKQYGADPLPGAHVTDLGLPVNDAWNVYALRTSVPPHTYFLNSGISGLYSCVAVDYVFSFRAAAGALIVLDASSVDSGQTEIRNIDTMQHPIVIPDVAPAPFAFNGQFLQLDVVSIIEAP